MAPSPIDAIAWVRSRPHQFFPNGEPNAVDLLPYLVADVVRLGGGDCAVRQRAGWWIVGSDIDWCAGTSSTVAELFTRVVPAPAHGVHSMRSEILIAAFASAVSISLGGERTWIVGREPPASVWNAAADLHRVFVFAM